MRVMVKNVNRYGCTLEEQFRGKTIMIKCGESIEMESDEAALFKGQFKPMVRDKGGQQIPESMKSLVITPIDGTYVEKPLEFKCQACNFKATSELGLKRHITNQHTEMAYDDSAEDAHKEINKELKGES